MIDLRVAVLLLGAMGVALVPLSRLALRAEARVLLAQDPTPSGTLPQSSMPLTRGILAETPDFFYDVPAPAEWRALRDARMPPARELLDERRLELVLGPGLDGAAQQDLGWSTAWPEPVRAALGPAADEQLARSWSHEKERPRTRQGRAWRGATWDGLALFVVEVPGPPTTPASLLWTVLDPQSERAAAPVLVTPVWNEDLGALVADGLVEADLDGDGRLEIGFPGHTHNGTVSDVATRTYYRVEVEPLRLVEVLRYATREWLSVVSPGEAGYVHRVLVAPKPGELRLFVTYRNLLYGQDVLPLGEIELARSGASAAWGPRGRRCFVPELECYLDP
jgi:hypothetical protein